MRVQVAEFDTPANLLDTPGSRFASLVQVGHQKMKCLLHFAIDTDFDICSFVYRSCMLGMPLCVTKCGQSCSCVCGRRKATVNVTGYLCLTYDFSSF